MQRHNVGRGLAPAVIIAPISNGGSKPPPYSKGEIVMDFYKVPIGFGLALSANTAAMNRYAHLSEAQKQDILNKAHNVRSEKEMFSLVASLANGTME